MSDCIVKVIRVPGQVKEVALNGGSTVADALSAAEMGVQSGEEIKVNGVAASTDTSLNDGDRVILARGAKGNA